MPGPFGLITLAILSVLPSLGEVTAPLGRVVIRRGEQAVQAEARSPLQDGDRLSTDPGGGAVLYLDEGEVLYLGPATELDLASGPSTTTLRLHQARSHHLRGPSPRGGRVRPDAGPGGARDRPRLDRRRRDACLVGIRPRRGHR